MPRARLILRSRFILHFLAFSLNVGAFPPAIFLRVYASALHSISYSNLYLRFHFILLRRDKRKFPLGREKSFHKVRMNVEMRGLPRRHFRGRSFLA